MSQAMGHGRNYARNSPGKRVVLSGAIDVADLAQRLPCVPPARVPRTACPAQVERKSRMDEWCTRTVASGASLMQQRGSTLASQRKARGRPTQPGKARIWLGFAGKRGNQGADRIWFTCAAIERAAAAGVCRPSITAWVAAITGVDRFSANNCDCAGTFGWYTMSGSWRAKGRR